MMKLTVKIDKNKKDDVSYKHSFFYRLLNVLTAIALLIVFVISINIYSTKRPRLVIDTNASKIKCLSGDYAGKSYSLREVLIIPYQKNSLSSSQEEKAARTCQPNGFIALSDFSKIYQYSPIEKSVGSLSAAIFSSAITLIGGAAILIAIRRAMLYLIFGEPFFKKTAQI